MKKIKIYCKNCNKPLSEIINQTDEKLLSFKDGEDMLPENSFIHWMDSELNNLPENTYLFTSIDSVNLKNCKNDSFLIGCCGIGEFNHLNQVCHNCKTEVAVKFTDCWLYHFNAFDTTKIIVKDFTNEKNIRKVKLN